MRIFIAIQLPCAFRVSLCNACDGLRMARPGLRWVDPENMHLTLAFLGELDQAGIERAVQAARLAITSARTDQAISAFELCTAGLMTFPRRGPASVLAAAVGTGAPEVTVLAEYLERALKRVGGEAGLPFRPRERRPFSPHITVARAARSGVVLSASERSTPLVAACLVGTMAVYRSELGSGGAHHEIIKELAFCGDIDQG